MEAPNASQLRSKLRELMGKSKNIEAASIMSRDGLSTAAVLKDNTDVDKLGAMCAALLGLADTTAAELDRGTLSMVLISGSKGILLLIHLGKSHVLAVAGDQKINLGLALQEARKTAEQLVGMV